MDQIQQNSATHTIQKPNYLYLIWVAFSVGMCMMGIEMATSRLLTPYFGSSLYTWTSLIGAIMVCLTLGYHLGGYIADKYESEKLLYNIILGTGVYFSLVPFYAPCFIRPMLSLVTMHPLSLFLVSFITTLLLLGIPFILIGMISPYIIRLSSQHIEKIGRISGKIAAFSTLGSIVGTFVPVFLAIPLYGTKKTILYFGLLLIITAAIGRILILVKESKIKRK
jgi:predicted membrane-bound spermidine synthase